ncbi:MAG: methyl-accepting chemotaxis protein [Fibromonadaceae bacterium]|jgi:methyl-accepting chemotaxis protein|nr:methyl-accepting chemotaxis protein [Fibromonadaceae bacterium]
MKLKFKLSILMAAVMAVVIGAISALSLWQATKISTKLAIESVANAAGEQAEYWKGKEGRYIQMLRTIANIMEDYERIDVEDRRDQFDNILHGAMTSEPSLVNLYTIWKPNAIDGMDAKHIGRTGSTKTGQYAITYTRESGNIKSRLSADVANSMAYFNGPNSKKDRVEHPFVRKSASGKDAILVRMMVPIINRKTNETIGGVGLLLDVYEVQELVEEALKNNKKNISYMAVYSDNGFVMGSYRAHKVGKMLADVDRDAYGAATADVQRALERGEEFYTKNYIPELDEVMHMDIHPVAIGNSDRNWSVMVGMSEGYILKDVRSLSKFMIILALLSVAGTAVIIFIVLSAMTKPLIKVTETIKDISEGEGDLTQTIAVESTDEMGDLARHFNNLMQTLRGPIGETKSVVDNLAAASEQLSNVSSLLSSSSEETLKQATEVINRADRMSTNINAMASGAEESSVNANEVAGAAEQMSVNMNTIAAAVEEMSASIRQIAENAREAHRVADEATQKSNETTKVMSELGVAAKEIGQVTDMIKKIADKTNLLALNATIEAASAGEAGKGFAVVAGEIKELANQSAQSADDITSRIEGIQGGTSNAIKAIEEVSDIIFKMNQSVESIAGHVDQQTRASNEIASNVAQSNTGAKRVAGAISEVAKGSNDIAKNAGDAARRVGQVSDDINRMSQVAQESSNGAAQVSSSAHDLAKMADNLRKVMGKFKA